MRYKDEENVVYDLRMLVDDVYGTHFADKEHVETVVQLAQDRN